MKNICSKRGTFIALTLAIDIMIYCLGYADGYAKHLSEVKTYVGKVVSKEYLPEEIKENPVTKTIETYDKQYVVRVKDFTGSIVAMNVTKEEFNQIDIGEKLRR